MGSLGQLRRMGGGFLLVYGRIDVRDGLRIDHVYEGIATVCSAFFLRLQHAQFALPLRPPRSTDTTSLG